MQDALFSDLPEVRKPELNVDGGEILADEDYSDEDFIILEPHRLKCPRCGNLSERTYMVERGYRLPRKVCYRCREIDAEYSADEYLPCPPAKPYIPPDVKICKGPVWMVATKAEHNAASLAALRCPALAGVVVVMR